MKRKPALKRRRRVFIKFLEEGNVSPVQSFQYPKRINPGYTTCIVNGDPKICENGWHFVNTQKDNAKGWWGQFSKCYVVLPIGKTVSEKEENERKWSSKQLIFIGQINYGKLRKAYLMPGRARMSYRKAVAAKYNFLYTEAEKILIKWEKKNGRNGRVFIKKLRAKEQAKKRV